MVLRKLRHIRGGLRNRYPALDPAHESFRWLVMAAVMIATFMAVLDATIVITALPKLMSTFGVSVDYIDWVLTAYLLAFSVMLPSSGWFADHLGYKRIYLSGVFLFTAGSFLCSLAWNVNTLIAFRVIQGAGAGILMPVGMAIITREFPIEKRGLALGFWSIAASASVSLGPTLGGYLIDHFSWNTIFDVNVPLGIFCMAALIIILREHKAADVKRFDYTGMISLTVFLTTLLLALSSGNSAWNTGGWSSPFIITCFAIAAAALLIFLMAEITVKHPLIEIGLFRNYNFTMSNIAQFMYGLGMFGSTFLVPLYLQHSLGYTPLQAGMVFLPVGILQIISAPLAGYFTDRFGGKIPSAVGLIILAITFYQYGFLSAFSEKAQILIPLYVRGFAMGMLFSPLIVMALSDVPNCKVAQASGLVNVIRSIGGSFGVAIFGTVLTRRALFHTDLYAQQIDPGSPAYQETVRGLQFHAWSATGRTFTEALAKAQSVLQGFVQKQGFIQAVDDVFLLAALFVLISVVPILFVHNRRRQWQPGEPAVKTR
jgi:DHA2 family multidrug resistance protein